MLFPEKLNKAWRYTKQPICDPSITQSFCLFLYTSRSFDESLLFHPHHIFFFAKASGSIITLLINRHTEVKLFGPVLGGKDIQIDNTILTYGCKRRKENYYVNILDGIDIYRCIFNIASCQVPLLFTLVDGDRSCGPDHTG